MIISDELQKLPFVENKVKVLIYNHQNYIVYVISKKAVTLASTPPLDSEPPPSPLSQLSYHKL